IADIIADYLLNLKLISPHIHWLGRIHLDLHFFLLCKYLHTLYDARNQTRNVDSLKLSLVLSKFQLIECQEIFYHAVHLIGLINDDITVKVHTLRIVRDTVFESFRISLNESYRSLQLV